MTTSNLDDYLARAADRPSAYTDDALDDLLQQYDLGWIELEPQLPMGDWGIRIGAVTAAMAVVMLLWGVLTSGGNPDGDDDIAESGAVESRLFGPGEMDEDVTGLEWEKPGDHENPTRPYVNKVSLNNIDVLHLAPVELAGLGIRSFDSGSVEYFHLKSDGRWSVVSLGVSWCFVDHRQIDDGRLPTLHRFQPTLVTDPAGRRRCYSYNSMSVDPATAMEMRHLAQLHHVLHGTDWRGAHNGITMRIYDLFRRLDSLAQIQCSRINALVGIHVTTGRVYTAEESIAGRWHPDCILWYEPTAEFLAALPERYRNGIRPLHAEAPPRVASEGRATSASATSPDRRETTAPARTWSGGSTPEPMRADVESSTGDDVVTGDHVGLQQSASSSGAILCLYLGENPAHNETTLNYTLNEPRRLTLSLHAIDGRQLWNIVESADHARGSGTIPIDLSDYSSGMYLVALTTERGEQVVARLIVQR